ncbi:MAG TPA: hypothetical protein VK794_03775 [Steroidobacteraceae bacterium]|jgi:hypothetical protein|nr:hypothetical protein [Steroidobacteraceae bacterium]
MNSEWMKVMLEEIARKKAEEEQWRIEAQRRIEEQRRRDQGSCDTVREEHSS